MNLKKLLAITSALLTCVFILSIGASASSKTPKKKSITLDSTSITLCEGETFTLKPSVKGYKKCTVQWSSSDKSVAAVKKGGIVTALKEGTAEISVRIKGTDLKAVCSVIDIVSNDNKSRFEFNSDKSKVRALYGHSVDVDLLLRKQEPPLRLLHGTALKYIDSIRNYGLKSKSRQYVHLTEDKDLAIMTGSRHGQAVLLEINSLAMFNDGYNFYRTNNGTWLTTEVPVQYIIF